MSEYQYYEFLAVAARGKPAARQGHRRSGTPRRLGDETAHGGEDRLLVRVARNHATTVRMELLRRFRDGTAPAAAEQPRCTLADILDDAARIRADRQRREAVRRAEEQACCETARALARERRPDELANDEEAAWTRVAEMIATRQPSEYDNAIRLLTDLQALAERDDHPNESPDAARPSGRNTHANPP